MNSKAMRGICVCLFFLVFCAPFLSRAHAKEKGSRIQIVTADVDLAAVEKNRILDFKIEVKNTAKKDFIIENVYSDCGCLELDDKGQPATLAHLALKPGASIYIMARLDTNKVSGTFKKSVRVLSNDSQNKEAVWSVHGSVIDNGQAQPGVLEAVPAAVTFEAAPVGPLLGPELAPQVKEETLLKPIILPTASNFVPETAPRDALLLPAQEIALLAPGLSVPLAETRSKSIPATASTTVPETASTLAPETETASTAVPTASEKP